MNKVGRFINKVGRFIALAVAGHIVLGGWSFIFSLLIGLAVVDPCCYPASEAEAVQLATYFGIGVPVLHDLVAVWVVFIEDKG